MKRFVFSVLTLLMVLNSCAFSREIPKVVLFVVPELNFYEPEYVIPREEIEKRGFTVQVATISGQPATGISRMVVTADLPIAQAKEGNYAALLLVGGYGAES
jgi:putative intracellular protease/amidase